MEATEDDEQPQMGGSHRSIAERPCYHAGCVVEERVSCGEGTCVGYEAHPISDAFRH